MIRQPEVVCSGFDAEGNNKSLFAQGGTSTPIAAKCFHETANPLFDARYPFTLQAKPSINIKNSIDNGSFDYSERGVRGNGGEVQPFHGTDGCHPRQVGRQVYEQVDGQPRSLPTA